MDRKVIRGEDNGDYGRCIVRGDWNVPASFLVRPWIRPLVARNEMTVAYYMGSNRFVAGLKNGQVVIFTMML